jgi:Tic22-like family
MQIRSENQKLAKDARVRTMTADLVYDYLTQRPSDTSNVGFRLMPDKRQVKAALRLYSDAGQSVTSLRGVPVFQAEDLSVKVDSEVRRRMNLHI